jgi:hypothetical protein
MVMMMKLVLVVTVITFSVNVSFALYLIACGSSKSVNFQNRVFVPDSQHLSHVLKTENSIVVASSNSSVVSSPIYQSARIFTENGSYKFAVDQGRHWFHLQSTNQLGFSLRMVLTDLQLIKVGIGLGYIFILYQILAII